MTVIVHFIVWLYDLYLRKKMTSYYLYLNQFRNIDHYYKTRDDTFRRYIFFQIKKFERFQTQKQVFLCEENTKHLTKQLRAFIWKVFQQKGNSKVLYYFYISMYFFLFKSSYTNVNIIRNSNKNIIGFHSTVITKRVTYLLSALIDHDDPLGKSGFYLYYIDKMVKLSFKEGIPIVRLGPTTDGLKIKLGGQIEKNYNFTANHKVFNEEV